MDKAIEKAGGVKALAQYLGVSSPAISMWKRVPAERVASVEAHTGVPRATLRPDLFQRQSVNDLDPADIARAQEYSLLSHLLWRAPDRDILARVAQIRGNATPLGMAHVELAIAAQKASESDVAREFFALFIGLGRGELLPYASFYLTGFLHEKPLARIRGDLALMGLERDSRVSEPEDHIAVLCETMAYFICEETQVNNDPTFVSQRTFFEQHMKSWSARFFADLEHAESSPFYRSVGAVGRLFMEIEAEAFALSA